MPKVDGSSVRSEPEQLPPSAVASKRMPEMMLTLAGFNDGTAFCFSSIAAVSSVTAKVIENAVSFMGMPR